MESKQCRIFKYITIITTNLKADADTRKEKNIV